MHADWVHFSRTGTAPWRPTAFTGVCARLYGGDTDHDPDAYALEAHLIGSA